MTNTELAEKCVAYRAKNGLSQAELADRCGVSRCTLIKIEQGRGVLPVTAVKVAGVVGEEQ